MSNQIAEAIYVKFGKQRFPVASYEEASRKWNQFRDMTGAGGSQLAPAHIETASGKKIARISYNGRIWEMTSNNVQSQNKATLLCESVY